MQLNIKMESRFYSKAKSDSSIFIFLYRIYNWFTNKAKEKKTYEKKRTNKLLAVLLTGAMAMSMGACGNGGASTDNTQKERL